MSGPSDLVVNPSHYTSAEIECIDAIRAALGAEGFRDYCRGNVFKYTWRAGKKDHHGQDMQKAAFYARLCAGDDPRKGG